MSWIDGTVRAGDELHTTDWHVGFCGSGIDRLIRVEAAARVQMNVLGELIEIRT